MTAYVFGPGACGALDESARREWLVADGRGGYAMGTVAGLRTRIHEHLVPYHARQIEDFIDAIRADREPMVTGREATRSLEIVAGIYESARTGAAVELTPARAPERDRASGGDGTAAR